MKRILLLAIVACALAAPAVDAARTQMVHIYNSTPEELSAGSVRTYITADMGSEEEIEALRRRLIDAGARNVNWFGDNVIVADLPKNADFGPVLSSPAVTSRPEADIPDYTPGNRDMLSQVKYAYQLAERMRETPGVYAGVDFEERVNRVSPEEARRIRKAVMEHPGLGAAGPDDTQRALNQNSEIMTGSIKFYVILPESDGRIDPDREDWYEADGVTETDDLVAARSGAFAALLDYQSQYPGMGISSRMIALTPKCAYEPILHTMVDDQVWILDAMYTLDAELTKYEDPLTAVHMWNEKNKGGYDWIFTMFIGHSRTVVGHKFGDGSANYTAYASLGGPFLVNPYPAGLDPNQIGEDLVYSKIVQHETGHVFWTLDEYPGAPGTCASTSGYLNYANMNVNMTGPGGLTRCIDEIDCIMNQAARQDVGRPFCRWSQGHLGVIDDNNNAIPDVFEAPPRIEFETQGADTVNNDDYTIRLTAISQAVPNRNKLFSDDERVDYAAPLKEAQFSLGGGWMALTAADGRWDGMVEHTSIRIQGLPPGATTLKFRVRNQVGMFSSEYVKTVYFLGINFTKFGVTPRAAYNAVSWEVVGENFGAQFDVYRLDADEPIPDLLAIKPDDELPGTLVAADVKPSGPGNNGFVPYAAVDRDVVPGQEYRYYVNATGEVDFQGQLRKFNSPSSIVSQTAMLPVPRGSVVSHVSPNPFRDEVSFSITVPSTFASATGSGGGTYDQRVATPVEVAVYDVLGRRVRTLHNASSFEQVVTLRWDGTTSNGSRASSGVYFLRVKSGPAIAVEKILLVR